MLYVQDAVFWMMLLVDCLFSMHFWQSGTAGSIASVRKLGIGTAAGASAGE